MRLLLTTLFVVAAGQIWGVWGVVLAISWLILFADIVIKD